MARSTFKSTINIQLGTSVALRKAVAGVDLSRQQGENELIDVLTLPPARSGKKWPGLKNVSSAPGEAPSPQTGELRQGVASTKPVIRGQTRVEAAVGTRSEKSVHLELGTDKIEPRPHVGRLRDDKTILARIVRAFGIGAARAR